MTRIITRKGTVYLHANNWLRSMAYRLDLNNTILGDPKPTRTHNVEKLKALGIVGVYHRTRWNEE